MSSGIHDERVAIATLFNTGWAGATPVAMPNVPFVPPKASWVRLTYSQVTAYQVEIGSTRNQERAEGLLIVQVFTVLDIGDAVALQLADQVGQIFRNTTVVAAGADGDVFFGKPVVRVIGPDSVGTYFQVNVSVPYTHDAVL